MDSQLETLRARLHEFADRAATVQAAADNAGRDLSPTEAAELETLFENFEATEAQIKTREHILGMTGGFGRKTEPGPINAPRMPGRRSDPMPMQGSITGGRYADLFGALRKGSKQNSWRSLGEFVLTAMRDPLDARFRNAGMSESSGEDGGFAVPVEYWSALLDQSLDMEQLRPRCAVIPMASNMVIAPQFDYFDNTSGKRAGLVLQWADEGGTFTDQGAKVLPMTLRANKGGVFVKVTNEAAQDMMAFERTLYAAMLKAISAGFDYAILWGTGAGTFLGVMNSPCLKTVLKETATPQANDTILEINCVKMLAALHPACWANAIWLCSPSTLAQLFVLSQANGPFEGTRTASFVMQDGAGGLRILGRPVVVSDQCAVLGDRGDLILGDFSRYTIGLRRDARIETSIHTNWMTDELGIRAIFRAGGQPTWGTPIKLRTGDTVSSFVALEAR